MSTTALEKAKDDLFNLSPRGAAASIKEAAKLFKPLSDRKLEHSLTGLALEA